jgi:type I restriction enzyme R subunit
MVTVDGRPQRTIAFTPEQTERLRMMKDHIAASCAIERDDFDYAEFADKGAWRGSKIH